nr:MAG TPA: hypothetical protein [Caudoviricetes sp.]
MIFFCVVPGQIRDKNIIDYKINNSFQTDNQQITNGNYEYIKSPHSD